MADDTPVGMFEINLPPDAPMTDAKVPDFAKHFGAMTNALSSIAKTVTNISVTCQKILAAMPRMANASATGTAASTAAPRSRGPRARYLDLSNPRPVKWMLDLENPLPPIPPPPLPRSRGPVPPPPRPSPVPPPPVPGVGRGGAGGAARGRAAARSVSLPGGGLLSQTSTALAKGLGLETGFGAAAATVGLAAGLAYMGYRAGRMVVSAGEQAMRNAAQFSPQVAGLQAQVDMNRVMLSFRAANSPLMRDAATWAATRQMQIDNILGPGQSLYGAAMTVGGSLLQMSWLGGTVLGQALLWLSKSQTWQSWTMGAKLTSNGLFHDSVDGMTGGMLRLLERPMIDQMNKAQPTSVRWHRGVWERTSMGGH